MDVKIIVQSFSEGTVSIDSCEDENCVWITCLHNMVEVSVKVSIEELKHAIRKISAR